MANISKSKKVSVTSGPRSVRVGKMILEYRERNDVTQLTLAQELGYDYGNFIGMIETGKSIFPCEHWKKYAIAIGADPDEFLVAALSDKYPDMEEPLQRLLALKKKKK